MNRDSHSFGPEDYKYTPGVGARVPPGDRPLRPLEWIVLGHVGILLIGTTWAFGGMADWVRPLIAGWASLGGLLLLAAVQNREAWREGAMRPLWWLVPLVVFNGLVLAACLNPNLREIRFGDEIRYGLAGGKAGWPSTAVPGAALRALWLFDALWISCFNLVLVLRQRRALRLILFLVTANALALAVFGTVQKLSGAKGLFFDAVPSPQEYFFASFVYHNHWGSFIALATAACLGLTWHYARRKEARDFFHTPAFGGLVVVLILAVTVPLSTSRSCTALLLVLLCGAFGHWTVRLVRQRRHQRESAVLPLAGAGIAIVLALGCVWYVARDSIEQRTRRTVQQVGEMRARGSIGSRVALYGDTLRMAKDQPWFGWGMASYPHVFQHYNTQVSRQDRLLLFYHDAHSDWLQGLAEHGVVGLVVLGALGLLPLWRLRPRHFGSPVPAYLLVGCGLLLLYAWIEFPFGNVAVVLTWWLCYFCAIHYAQLYDREARSPTSRETSRSTPSGEAA